MANIADVKQLLAQLITKQTVIETSSIKDDSTLKGLGIEELDQVELLMSIEEEFTIRFDENTDFTTLSFAKMAERLVDKSK